MVRNLALSILCLLLMVAGMGTAPAAPMVPKVQMPACCMAMMQHGVSVGTCCCPQKSSCQFQMQPVHQPVMAFSSNAMPGPSMLASGSVWIEPAFQNTSGPAWGPQPNAQPPPGPLYIQNASLLI